MPEYHVGCGAFNIYAGTLEKNKKLWKNKSVVTEEVLSASAEYLFSNKKEFLFTVSGEEYIMRVVKEPWKDFMNPPEGSEDGEE